jgi:membrane protein DedA with SNARE-associated domain
VWGQLHRGFESHRHRHVGYLAGLSYDRAAAWLGGGATAVVAVIVIGALIVWHVRRRQREKALEHEPAGA